MLNKMEKKFCIICGLGMLLFSCQQEETDLSTDSAQRIYLRAAVENNAVKTRAPFSSTAPDRDAPLYVEVWASTTTNEFKDLGKDGTDGTVALHTKAHFTNEKEQLLDDAVYPKDKGTVYFVGLHPGTGWSDSGNGMIAKRTFNGSEDVMFAPQISGVYGGNVGVDKWPTFTFKHLLTWLKVKVKAESEDISDAWGKLKSLKVKGEYGNTVTIDLSKEYSQEGCVTFSSGNGVELYFCKTGTDDAYQNASFTIPYDTEAKKTEAKEVAYVLCAPVTASDKDSEGNPTSEYTLIVETERRTVEVPVDLMDLKEEALSYFTGSTMNCQFTLNLNFKMGDNIIVTASVNDWEVGGISNGVLDPNDD